MFVFQVPDRLYQLVDRSTDGLVTADQVMEFIAGLQATRYVRQTSKAEKEILGKMENSFELWQF